MDAGPEQPTALRDRSPPGSRKRGYIGFLIGTDHPVRIRRHQIEGKIAPEAWSGLMEAWIDKRLAALVFD